MILTAEVIAKNQEMQIGTLSNVLIHKMYPYFSSGQEIENVRVFKLIYYLICSKYNSLQILNNIFENIRDKEGVGLGVYNYWKW